MCKAQAVGIVFDCSTHNQFVQAPLNQVDAGRPEQQRLAHRNFSVLGNSS